MQCRELQLLYMETDSEVPIEIGKTQTDDKSDGSLPHDGEPFGWPRVVLTIYPKHLGGPLDESSEGEPESSLDDTLENAPKHQPSPFSSKRVVHESDTPHVKQRNQGDKDEDHQR